MHKNGYNIYLCLHPCYMDVLAQKCRGEEKKNGEERNFLDTSSLLGLLITQ